MTIESNKASSENRSDGEDVSVTIDCSVPTELLIDGRYQIISSIGDGGMGRVYRCLDTVLQREVAVKNCFHRD